MTMQRVELHCLHKGCFQPRLLSALDVKYRRANVAVRLRFFADVVALNQWLVQCSFYSPSILSNIDDIVQNKAVLFEYGTA